jgi:hyperosmotically inducible protein
MSSAALSNQELSNLTRGVRHELIVLPWYSIFDNLAFRVDPDGTVTLMGQVVLPVLKDDAERVVKKISGVTRVKNDIEVLPLSPDDDRIRKAEFRAIYGDPALSRYAQGAVPPIHIVKNGNVTLEGVVATQMDKQLAYLRANAVPGGFSVTNDLRVEE